MTTDIELRQRAIGETTALVLVIGVDGIVGRSAGDSEAWIVSGVGVDQLTEGQPRRRLGHPSVVGGDAAEFQRASFAGTLVAATDGLFKYASRETICELAALPPAQACRALTDAVRLSNGSLQDDVGVVVARATSN